MILITCDNIWCITFSDESCSWFKSLYVHKHCPGVIDIVRLSSNVCLVINIYHSSECNISRVDRVVGLDLNATTCLIHGLVTRWYIAERLMYLVLSQRQLLILNLKKLFIACWSDQFSNTGSVIWSKLVMHVPVRQRNLAAQFFCSVW